jgi:DNA invertase Pin-like site-specific DNA recombinase
MSAAPAARQLREGRAWCERHGAVLDESLGFLTEQGKSAFRGRNLDPKKGGGLGLFLKALESGQVPQGAVLLVERLDRVSRAHLDVAFGYFCQVLRAGASIVSVRNGTEYTVEMLEKNPTSLMAPVLELILAAEESNKKSDLLLSAWAAKREKQARKGIPMSKKGPLWLRLREDRSGWDIIEERAAVVRRIFQLAADGIGTYRIAARLNKEGVKPMGRRPHWSQNMVIWILGSRATLGEFTPKRHVGGKRVEDGQPVPGYFPAIIMEQQWFAAQAQLRAHRTGGRKPGGRIGERGFLFAKLAFDADTDSSLVIRSTLSGGRYVRYLIPSAGLRGARRISVPLDAFERTLLKGLSEIKPSDIMPPAGTIDQTLAAAKAHLSLLAARIAAATAAMAHQAPENMGGVVAQIAAWREEERDWTRQVEELAGRDAASDPVADIKSVMTMYDDDSTEDTRSKIRAAIRRLVKKVTVKIKPGRTRLQRRVGALVEFHGCPEGRVYLFSVPGDGTSVVLSGWTAAELAAM